MFVNTVKFQILNKGVIETVNQYSLTNDLTLLLVDHTRTSSTKGSHRQKWH